ncbi:MAG: hypothetical protein U1F87_01015 [Kiritimatiellia bacterium]
MNVVIKCCNKIGAGRHNLSFRRFVRSALLAMTMLSPRTSPATTPAYLLDTSGLSDVGELYLIGTLQGIVNRDAPRLFLVRGSPDQVYADYLEREKDSFSPGSRPCPMRSPRSRR